jgi:hypothetical protein
MKPLGLALFTWSVIPIGGITAVHADVTPSHSVAIITPTPTSAPIQAYPTPLPADISYVTVKLLHVVHNRWKPTTVVHLNERSRFVLTWSADAGRLYTAAAAYLTVSQNGRTVYQAYRADTVIRPGGSFQWTVRFRDPRLVGQLDAAFDMRLNNGASGSLTFILKRSSGSWDLHTDKVSGRHTSITAGTPTRRTREIGSQSSVHRCVPFQARFTGIATLPAVSDLLTESIRATGTATILGVSTLRSTGSGATNPGGCIPTGGDK